MIPGFCAVILKISVAHPDYSYLLYRSGLRKQVKNTCFRKILAAAALEARWGRRSISLAQVTTQRPR